jgi:ACS family hexuronate transporter-like MFS transporter
VIDKIGTKLGLAFSLIIWSVFGMLNALAGSTVVLHAIIRSLFGIGEAGNFPASIKTIAEWFPKKERALATGIFNCGANLGAMIASVFVPWCMLYWGNVTGYKMAYLITGASGFIWLIFWFAFYTTPGQSKRLSKEEYDYIHSDDEITHAVPSGEAVTKQKISWFSLLKYPQTWAFFTGKFLTDGIWWFLLFWLPDYLKKQFGLTGEQVILPTFIVYGIAILGSTFGGSLPLLLINKGMTVYKARMTAMFIIALFPLVLLTTQYFGNRDLFGTNAIIFAVTLICIAAAAHQAWSANIFTTVSDMFPKTAVGSVTGIGGMAGGIGGVLFQLLAGRLTDHFKATPQIAYGIMFTICALAYITAWAIIRILTAKSRHVIL